MTYDGLNHLLQATDSLAAGTRSSVDAIDFDTNYDVPSLGLDASRIRSITADKITSGTISGSVIYAGSISANKITSGTIGQFQIIVNDGTTDRILIGYGSGLF
jgi:hypothetical protein